MSQWATLSEPRSSAPPAGDDGSEDEFDQLRPSANTSFASSRRPSPVRPPMDRTRPPSTVPAKRRNDDDGERDGSLRLGALCHRVQRVLQGPATASESQSKPPAPAKGPFATATVPL
ncbi:hypothetical protein AURDEDRAFT_173002 [Auricularia subglabra TFB-10046 SS5]|uniref:Uncharacterized protein n=1 Tax=Auricularia subglabra (strain TFB-10046 / SS5) TaxID=717982 RepID=J0D0W9_AURST|nr:hypothetical protein AURDEDRAFT_173002 [Auricularia subglabra TFB-10046 SS5]